MTIYFRIPKSVGWFAFVLLLSLVMVAASLPVTRLLYSPRMQGEDLPSANAAFPLGHLIGGFSISSMSNAASAASDGVQTIFTYGPAYPSNSAMGRTIGATLHMTQVESQPWELLYQYECHRLVTLHKPWNGYCSQDYPEMTLSALLAGVKSDILTARQNNQVVGVWILDDWPAADPGGAASILPSIAQIIHSFAPHMPTICGFGAELGPHHTDIFDSAVFANYSPAACNEVALYIYSEPVANGATTTTFDWSMSTLLPKIWSTLRARGWNLRASPVIGIPQAFGGARTSTPNTVEATPTASEIAQQSASFCKAGASGVVYYAWYDSSLTNLQTPANNAAIEQGVRVGIQACKTIWKQA